MKTLIIALLLLPLTALADTSVCYGTFDAVCHTPSLSVQPAATLTAPADLAVQSEHATVTLFVTSPVKLLSQPVVAGGTVVTSSDSGFIVTGAPPLVVSLPPIDGSDLVGGEDVRLAYKVADPNQGLTLAQGAFTVLHVTARTEKRIPLFNPAGNPNQQSVLRLSNLGDSAQVTLVGIDDNGGRSIPVTLTLAANASLQLTGDDLEQGNPAKGLIGNFGTGTGKWQVLVVSPGDIAVMGLMRNGATGPLTNLSQSVP